MIVLLKLILAHFLGDFVLQPKLWVKDKENKKAASGWLYLHILLHGLLILLVLWDLNDWLFALCLMIVHGIIDIIKVSVQTTRNKTKCFLIDQGVHIISILLLWGWWFQPDIPYLSLLKNPSLWLIVTAVVFLCFVSSVLIQNVMSKWSDSISEGEDDSLNKAGKFIGILERLLIFIFILSGHWAPVGFLLAAKSVFRFGDLKESKDRKLTEYILIGTLLSFGTAIMIGIIVALFV